VILSRPVAILSLICLSGYCFGQNGPLHGPSHPSPPLRLWYDKPATIWEETLPLGNGRLGMMPDGGIQQENIVLNDITLWSGSPQDANNYEAHTVLPRIRQLLLEGKNDSAQALVDQSFICKGQGSGGVPYGCYQVLGNLHLKFTYGGSSTSTSPDHYERELSLNNAVATCTYRVNGVTYKREYFTSFGDDVDVIRITADHPGQLNCEISIDRPERSVTTVSGKELQLSGQLDNGTDGKGMQYLSRVKCRLKGGTLTTGEKSLVIKNATEIILIVSASTDWKGAPFRELSAKTLATAFNRPYAEQLQRHIAAYQKLFNRLSLTIGPAAPRTAATPAAAASTLPTNQRLIRYHQDPTADIGFPVLFFQFGRYLNIASTRVGLLPPNLQGLWANQIHTPWNGDYHLDINIQMNQWPVEAANLSELNLPLADLVAGMIPEGEKTAKAYYNADGWVAHVITNIWGFTEPGESASWGVCKVGGGWLCDNLWQHYAFTGDLAYLQKIYPILKGSAEFYNSMLIEDPDNGWLVTAPSSSPENSFLLPNGHSASICMGPTIDNQIIRELFDNVITASKRLGIDASFSATLAGRLHHLPPPGVVGPDGRLMEWLKPYAETEPHHRHVSHLYGLYPASLITPDSTPDLAEACRKTLETRGDDGPSWSIAYKILWWARLHDGNRAGKLLNQLLNPTIKTDMNYGAGGGIYPDLLSAGPPFQIDGNYGAEAGIAEMLIQSHAGYIELLPAIPDTWKPSGRVYGLKARGNFTVDFQWKDGRVTEYRITTPAPAKTKVKVNGEIIEVTSGPVVHQTTPPLPYANYFARRNGLGHSHAAITKDKKLTVAFLGGSITYNPGWREKVCAWLKASYPKTDFHFISAGIPSLGSVPHAFRLQRDVLDSGRVDLLFLETAVNDRGNGTDSLSQLRALEGIVRHARHNNPDMDIILMAFADPDKTKDYDNGKVPVEIANQELVAAHYELPSINIAKEVHDKIRNGEFSWEKDFKDIHPAEFGQQLYFDNIKALLTTQPPATLAPSPLPPPLDKSSLENGRYLPVDAAHHDTAWTLDKDWTPKDKADTRPGFVHVPVLESTSPGAELSLQFNGTAVGIAVISGPDAGIIGYSIDDQPFRQLNLYTQWSNWLHLPWYLLLGSGLTAGPHILHIKISEASDPHSKGHASRIVHFLVNDN
jgi:alpha-L-fucosidase 2